MDVKKKQKEVEENYLKIGNQVDKKQQELNDLMVEKTRLEGEYRLLEKLKKEDIK